MNIYVPQIVRTETSPVHKGREMTKIVTYAPPIDGSLDPHREFDEWAAGQAMIVLCNSFPGYPWDVVCNCQQGVVHFGIRLLQKSLRYVIKLGDWADLTPALVRKGGGEVLDRWNLPTEFDEASFIKARDNPHLADASLKKRLV